MVKERIESYLINLSLTYEEVGENIWVINDEDKGLGRIIVFAEESLVWFRTKVMEIPKNNKLEFFEQLLKLNAEMVHGAYAIEEDGVILVDSLEYNTLDFEEFQASLDAMGLALAQHYPRLSKYLNN